MRIAGRAAATAAAVVFALAATAARAQSSVPCGRFTPEALAAPAPREAAAAVRRFEDLNRAVKTQPYRVLFFGNSLTQLWNPAIWNQYLARRGVLNVGVSGDRTEHLMWRLDHGNLDGPPPRVAIVLIGTNDLGAGRDAAITAEGVRAVVVKLRDRLPNTRVLLLGLLPRGATPADRYRQKVGQVNDKLQHCGDNKTVFYADIGGVLLDYRGDLSQALSFDLLHFTAAGYERLASPLTRLLDPLLAMGPP